MIRTRVNEIDLLRFLAALSVVFYHYAVRGPASGHSVMTYPLFESAAKYGYLGVELFFMISGFVVLMTAAASARLRDFCISRIVRLYPAFWVCCTITYLVTVALAPPQSVTFSQYASNMTMVSGLWKVPPIDRVYWSLLVEIRFYALVAVVLALGSIYQAQRWLVLWLLACIALEILATFPLNGILARALHYVSYLLITSYAAYFIAGAILFLIWEKGVSLKRLVILLASWGLAVFQSGPILRNVVKDNPQMTLDSGIVTGILTGFFVVMLLIALRRTGSIAHYRWPLAGAISYPLYLLHQNIGYLVFNRLYPAINAHALFWGTIIVVLGASYAIHAVVERRLASRMKAVLCATLTSRTEASTNV